MTRKAPGSRLITWLFAALILAVPLPAPLAIPAKAADLTPAAKEPPAYGDLEAIRARGSIRVLVPLSRTDFYLDSGAPRGRAAQRLSALADALSPLAVDYILTPRDQLLDDLAAGRGDLAAGSIEISADNLKTLDFSRPVASPAPDVFVTRRGGAPVKSLADLAGRNVYLRRDSRTLAYARALDDRLRTLGLAPMTIMSLPDSLGEEDLLDMLNAGLIDLTITSRRLAEFWARPLPHIHINAPLDTIAVPPPEADFVWVFRQESPALAAALNGTLDALPPPSDDDVARWARNARKLQNARSPAALKRLAKTLPLFEKAGAELNLDPLVIAAVGYQESRLKQNARGANGATGLMQMRASLAKQMKSGPVTALESNIEGGARYMNYLADHLFGDSKPDRLNRSLIAAAAYNMGPATIRKAQEKARAMGLDPNVWFDNLELAIITTAGLRPILYVRDIFKYYVAYKAEFALRDHLHD